LGQHVGWSSNASLYGHGRLEVAIAWADDDPRTPDYSRPILTEVSFRRKVRFWHFFPNSLGVAAILKMVQSDAGPLIRATHVADG
jgi:hypothetical protein